MVLFVSCSSLKNNDSTLTDTAINLAAKQIENNQYEDALNTYNTALSKGYNYSLLINKSLVQEKLKDFEGAIETVTFGYKHYKDHPEFLKAKAYYYYQMENLDGFIDSFEEYLGKAENTDDKIYYMNLCFDSGLQDKAYQIALELWESKVDKKEVVKVLYSIKPDEWEIINKITN